MKTEELINGIIEEMVNPDRINGYIDNPKHRLLELEEMMDDGDWEGIALLGLANMTQE